MNTITFKCETVTPMFMAGADGKKPELRAPSIKGVLRFWWRAINGNLKLEDLRKREAAIFGGSGKDQGRSKVIIQVKKINYHEKDNLWGEIPVKQNKNGKNYNEPEDEYKGISYLYYSVFMLNENQRRYIDVSSTFNISFSSNNVDLLIEGLKAFLFMVYFGALGAKSRRGAGAFRVIAIESDCKNETDMLRNLLDLFDTKKILTLLDLKKRIETILAYLPSSSCDDYSVLQKENIYLFPPKNDWKDALKRIADPFYYFRSKKEIQSDYLRTPNFGFPIIHKKPKVTLKARNQKKHNEIINRRASPLIFKLIKTGDSLYFPVIIRLNGKLIPNGYEIYTQPHNKNQVQIRTSMPDSTIIEEFLNFTLQNREVIIL